MNTNFMKKTGLVISYIARDFFTLEVGTKIPSVAEYAARFSVSRGIVQDSLAYLENQGAVSIRREGARGTFLTGVFHEALQRCTGWDAITGTMPVPLNQRLSSLATAINHEMRHHVPMPGSFAYISGSGNRLANLAKMMYDFIIVSQSTAQLYLKEYDYLEEPLLLENCYYSRPYSLYITNPEYSGITDGMRVAIDPNSTDQCTLTHMLCAGKNVEFVEIPYIGLFETVTKNLADCMVHRQEQFLDDKPWVKSELIDVPGFSISEVVTPAILVHKNNYGLKRLLERYISVERMRTVQREVLSGQRSVRIY